MNQTLVNLLLALITHELAHNIIEIMSAREKVKRLDAYSSGKPWKEMKFNINTRAKSYTISVVGLIVIVLPLWGLFTWLELSGDAAVKYSIVALIITYVLTFVGFDRYHVDIEQVTRRFRK